MDQDEIIIVSSDDEELVVENNNTISTAQVQSPSTQVNQNTAIECINIDDDDDDGQIPSSSNQVQIQKEISPQGQIISAIDELLCQLRNILKPDAGQRFRAACLRLLPEMDLTNTNTFQELINLIHKVPLSNTSHPSIKLIHVANIQIFMESHINRKPTSTPKQQRKRQIDSPHLLSNEKKGHILEKELKKLAKNIREMDQKPVDLNDEDNSSYLQRDRMMKQWMKAYQLYCQGFDLNPSLDRPIEKRIKLKTSGIYPEITSAIEKYMNSKDVNFTPQFRTIEDIVGDVNMSENLNIPDVSLFTQPIYKEIVLLVHSRRKEDFDQSVLQPQTDANVNIELVDPSEYDEELRKKLEENSKVAKSEKDVFDLFIQKQMDRTTKDKDDKNDSNYDEGSGDEISDNEDVLISANTDDEEEIMDEEPSTSREEQPDNTEEEEIVIIDD